MEHHRPQYHEDWPSWQQFTNPAMLHVVAHQRRNKLRRAHTSSRTIQAQFRSYQQRKQFLRVRASFIQFERLSRARLTKIRHRNNCGAVITKWLKRMASQTITERLYLEQLQYRSAVIFQCLHRSRESKRIFQRALRTQTQGMLSQYLIPRVLRRQALAIQSHSLARMLESQASSQGIARVLPLLAARREELKSVCATVATSQWTTMLHQQIVPLLCIQWDSSTRLAKWYRFHKIRKYNWLQRRFELNRAAIIIQKIWRILVWKKIVARAKVFKMIEDLRTRREQEKKKKEREEYKKRLKKMQRKMDRRVATKKSKKKNRLLNDMVHDDDRQESCDSGSAPSQGKTSDDEDESEDGDGDSNDNGDSDSNNEGSNNYNFNGGINEEKLVLYMERLVVLIIQRTWRRYRLRSYLYIRIRLRRATQLQQWWRAVIYNVTFKRHLFLRVRLRKLEHDEWSEQKKIDDAIEDAQHLILIDWHAIQCQRIWKFYNALSKEGNRVWWCQQANDVAGVNAVQNRIHTLLKMEQERVRRIREDAASIIIQAYWRRERARRLYLSICLHRDRCAIVLQSCWRMLVGWRKGRDMAEYWARMKVWTLEQEFIKTPEGRASKIRNKILQRSISQREQYRKKKKQKMLLAGGGGKNITLTAGTGGAGTGGAGAGVDRSNQAAAVRPSMGAHIRASLASTRVFVSAAIRSKFIKDKTNKGKQKQRMKRKKIPKWEQRNNQEIFRDDELEVGDLVLARWNESRVAWPAEIVGIHFTDFVSQFTGNYIGNPYRTFDLMFQEDRLMDYRVPISNISEVLKWRDQGDKDAKSKEAICDKAERAFNKVLKKSKDPKVVMKAKKMLERDKRAAESSKKAAISATKTWIMKRETERVGFEAPDAKLADLLITTKAQKNIVDVRHQFLHEENMKKVSLQCNEQQRHR